MKLQQFINEGPVDVEPYFLVEFVYKHSFPFIKQYLKEFRATPSDRMFYSGRMGNDIYDRRKIRKDRDPKDTPYEIHNMLDDMFYQEFHVRYRSNSIFVTGKLNEAKGYGDHVYGIFPCGTNYKFVCSGEVGDLYSEVVDSGSFMFFGEDVGNVVYNLSHGDNIFDEVQDDLRYKLHKEWEDSQDDKDLKKWKEEGVLQDKEEEWVDDEFSDRIDDALREKAEELIENDTENVEAIIRTYKENKLKWSIMTGNEIMLSGDSFVMIRYDYVPYIMRYMEVMGSKAPTKERFAEAMRNMDPKKYPSIAGLDVRRHFKKFINPELLSILDDLKAPK